MTNDAPKTSGSKSPTSETALKDTTAGLIVAVSSVPDGMASSMMANASPIYGLYASIFGPIVGGMFASSERMMITTTSAAALAASQVLAGLPADAVAPSLFLLVFLSGLMLLAAGLLHLGVITRFVSHSVMTGFLIGVAMLIILGQIGTLVGYEPEANNKVAVVIKILANLSQIDLPSLIIGLLTIALAVLLPRTALRSLGQLVALAVPTLLVAILQMDSVALVNSVSEIPGGLPLPVLPSLSHLTPELLTGALAIAVITLVQSTGVSQSTPNLNGKPADQNRDFSAQGLANIVTGLFQGIPVGGSVGQTALSVSAGARTRWAAISSGIWMLIIVLIFPGVVAVVPMPALAALLILAGIQAINLQQAIWIWRTGMIPRIMIATTFGLTLFLPIQVAVTLAAMLSAVLYLSRLSVDITIVELVELSGGQVEERKPPSQLPDRKVTVLGVYGSLFYAGVRTLEQKLPSPRGSNSPVVLLRLRGTSHIGATFVQVVTSYADALQAVGGQLYLSGLSQHVYDQLQSTGKLQPGDSIHLYSVSQIVGASTRDAYEEAMLWISSQRAVDTPDTTDAVDDSQ